MGKEKEKEKNISFRRDMRFSKPAELPSKELKKEKTEKKKK